MSKSKVVVVTGVSSGIGRAAAIQFAQQGCQVFGTVRNTAKSHAIPNVTLVEMDIRDDASVERGIQAIIAQAQHIDVLVNSAGVTLLGAAEETSIEEAKTLFDTNLFGLLRVIKAVLPYMREQRSGRIVNVSSVLGFLPAPYMALYSASKHAVEGLAETLDHEVRQFGIRVSLVEPSFTKTNLDLNAPQTVARIADYSQELEIVSKAIQSNVQKAPRPRAWPTPSSVPHSGPGRCATRPRARHRCWPSCAVSCLQARLERGFANRSDWRNGWHAPSRSRWRQAHRGLLQEHCLVTQLESIVMEENKPMDWAAQQSDAVHRVREGGGLPGLARAEQIGERAAARSSRPWCLASCPIRP